MSNIIHMEIHKFAHRALWESKIALFFLNFPVSRARPEKIE